MGKDKSNMRYEYQLQQQNQAAQNAWQSQENDIDRQWQANEWIRQFTAQSQEQMKQFYRQLSAQRESDMQKWLEQFNLQNEYNSPHATVARLQAAGINPAAAMNLLSGGESSASIGGSSSPSGFSAPSGGQLGNHSVTPIGLTAAGYSTDAALFSSIAQLGDSLGKMAQSGMNVSAQSQKLKPEIDKILAETDSKRAQTALTNIQNDIQNVYGKSQAAQNLIESVYRSYSYYMSGNYSKAQSELSVVQKQFTGEQLDILKKQAPDLITNVNLLGQIYKSEVDVNKAKVGTLHSETAKNYSQADLNSAIAQTENAIRDGKVTNQQLSNGIAAIEYGLKTNSLERDNQTQQEQIYSIIQRCQTSGLIKEEQAQRARQAIKDNNWYEFDKIFNMGNNAWRSASSWIPVVP